MELGWLQWIQFVEAPVVIFLCRWIYNTNRDLEAFKLKVAEHYVSADHLKEVEERLVKSMERIEAGLADIRKTLISREP